MNEKVKAFISYVGGLAAYCCELEKAGMVDHPYQKSLIAASTRAKVLLKDFESGDERRERG